jgi:tetratricopeptide (TPR) repeat protein
MEAARVDREFDARLRSAAQAFAEGRRGEARSAALELSRRVLADPVALQRLAELLGHIGDHELALALYRQAAVLSGEDSRALYNLSAALIATGRHDEARRTLDRVIALDPADGDAWHNRATLRTASETDNDIEALAAALERAGEGPAAIPLGFALAKELEDVGRHDEAFATLSAAAARRRARLSYRVETDLAMMEQLATVFDRAWAGDDRRGAPGEPIFVLGLPRTGSTLTDRILAAHSQVDSLGEIPDFSLAMMRLAGEGPRETLVRRAAAIDPAALGAAYQARLAGYEAAGPRLVDKTPSNFLNLGLILKSLPRAKVVHLRRDPVDACYAIYKTLFRMGYPYSYDLEDLGRYYAAYRRLMDHWAALFPGRILDLSYEDLTADQEGQTRRLLDFCGLDFEPACLDFQRAAGPAATASAVQVRQPLHGRSVGSGRRLAGLEPLRVVLRREGAPC